MICLRKKMAEFEKFYRFVCGECEQIQCDLFTTEERMITMGIRMPEQCPWGVKKPKWFVAKKAI